MKRTLHFEFDDNLQALQVFGPNESHLQYLKKHLPVSVKYRGNQVTVEGGDEPAKTFLHCLEFLRGLIRKGIEVQLDDVMNCMTHPQREERETKVASGGTPAPSIETPQNIIITSPNKSIYTRTPGQRSYVEAMLKNDVVFGVGPAGTGKTYLAMAVAMSRLIRGEVERIILTRPAVEAGEKLGFLPGDLIEKVNPYLRPLYDALHDMVDHEKGQRMLASGQIEIAPLAFMRGRTLNNSCVILDEAQNCTQEQMKMFLTRLGVHSSAVITGDVTQVDLPSPMRSGLVSAIKILQNIRGIHIHFFDDRDVVRHSLVAEIIKAYERDSQPGTYKTKS